MNKLFELIKKNKQGHQLLMPIIKANHENELQTNLNSQSQ
jgi:hypothetical protein